MAFEQERQELALHLENRGIRHPGVLRAIRSVPRHEFVGTAFRQRAYEDSALPIECQQTISQPYTVAVMTELLDVQAGDRILEIGTGSGYQACVLATMGARVFTIERHFGLLETARARMDALGYRIASKVGDGSIGWSEFAPYQGIIVTAGAPEVPPSLLQQLAEGGRLVIPVGGELQQDMLLVHRQGTQYHSERIPGFKFVPLIGKEGWKK